jgi:hypothetical protein
MSRCIFWASAIAVALLTSAVAHAQSSSEGQSIFRFDTFGGEQLYTDALRLQEALKNVSPRTALSVGLKVDSDALPAKLIDDIKAGRVNLDDPAVTIQLLRRNAVIGVITDNAVKRVGITCALCHSQVDNSVAPGIGKRLDGWPNRAPPPPAGSFNKGAAKRGEDVFNGPGRCATCHIPPLFTDVNENKNNPNAPLLHSPGEVGQEPVYASRSATKTGYRTTPLRALWQHPPYFHDGSAPTLPAVVDHYDRVLMLGLTDRQKADLVEYLKTL